MVIPSSWTISSSSLKTTSPIHIFPHISDKPVKAITAPEIIELLKPIEAKGSLETVKRLTQRLNEVMNF
ncbi:MAG: phage integrase central domain-containing protein, partial [Shewanella sp.]